MFIKSIALILLGGLSINANASGTIKTTEESNLSAKCTIISESRMECQEYCTVYNRATGAQISEGDEGEFWNCTKQNEMDQFQAKYNNKPENADKQASGCKAQPGKTHEGDCIIDVQQLIPATAYFTSALLVATEWKDCVFDPNKCPGAFVEIEFNGNNYKFIHNEPRSGFSPIIHSDWFPWVYSPTGEDVSNQYTITPQPTLFQSVSTYFNNGNEHFKLPYGFRACKNSDPTDCMNYDYLFIVSIED